MDWLSKVYIGAAVLGGAIVVVRIILLIVGGSFDADVDMDVDADVDFDVDADAGDGLAGGEADTSFAIFSLQTISGFLLMFGLIGLAILQMRENGAVWSIVGGGAAGTLTAYIFGKLMASMKKLQSSGTINLQNAIGTEGDVYLTIPADGIGKVQIAIQGGLKIFNAKSADDAALPTGSRVEVVQVVSGNVLVVKKKGSEVQG